jgi:hypothetical protein
MLLAFGESLALHFATTARLGCARGIGALISRRPDQFLAHMDRSVDRASRLGDWLSYWIGAKLEYTAQNVWPLSRHPELIPKGEAFMNKWGIAGIFIGRFFGPLRARCHSSPASSTCRSGVSRLRTSPGFVWAAGAAHPRRRVRQGIKWIWGGYGRF